MAKQQTQRLVLLNEKINSFFEERKRQRQKIAREVSAHTLKVASYVNKLYTLIEKLGQTDQSYEYTLAGAFCHDIGRLRQRPSDWDLGEKLWAMYVDKQHPNFSADDCTTYLSYAKYDPQETERIQEIIISHSGQGITSDSSLEFKVIVIADKLDQIGIRGAWRLYRIRTEKYPEWTKEQKVQDAEIKMRKAYDLILPLGIAPEYIQSEYEKGIQELQRLGEMRTKS